MTEPTATSDKVKNAFLELVTSGSPAGLNAVHRKVGGNKTTVKRLLDKLRETGELKAPDGGGRLPFVSEELERKLAAIIKACEEIPEIFQENCFGRVREERALIRAELLTKPCPHCGRAFDEDAVNPADA